MDQACACDSGRVRRRNVSWLWSRSTWFSLGKPLCGFVYLQLSMRVSMFIRSLVRLTTSMCSPQYMVQTSIWSYRWAAGSPQKKTRSIQGWIRSSLTRKQSNIRTYLPMGSVVKSCPALDTHVFDNKKQDSLTKKYVHIVLCIRRRWCDLQRRRWKCQRAQQQLTSMQALPVSFRTQGGAQLELSPLRSPPRPAYIRVLAPSRPPLCRLPLMGRARWWCFESENELLRGTFFSECARPAARFATL